MKKRTGVPVGALKEDGGEESTRDRLFMPIIQ
jgi:hypothetical protein